MAKQGRILEYLRKVQDYMNRLSYNHTGTQFFETRPNSSLHTLVEAAKVIVREALPIKCMEAVVLAIYLTNGVPGMGRFTINFKSELPPFKNFPLTPIFRHPRHRSAISTTSSWAWSWEIVLERSV
jgi:hypothetical protein